MLIRLLGQILQRDPKKMAGAVKMHLSRSNIKIGQIADSESGDENQNLYLDEEYNWNDPTANKIIQEYMKSTERETLQKLAEKLSPFVVKQEGRRVPERTICDHLKKAQVVNLFSNRKRSITSESCAQEYRADDILIIESTKEDAEGILQESCKKKRQRCAETTPMSINDSTNCVSQSEDLIALGASRENVIIR
jgi:hypothetical protein